MYVQMLQLNNHNHHLVEAKTYEVVYGTRYVSLTNHLLTNFGGKVNFHLV